MCFLAERLAPMTTAGLRKTVARIGDRGKFPSPVHPHMLRHACGFIRSFRRTLGARPQ